MGEGNHSVAGFFGDGVGVVKSMAVGVVKSMSTDFFLGVVGACMAVSRCGSGNDVGLENDGGEISVAERLAQLL